MGKKQRQIEKLKTNYWKKMKKKKQAQCCDEVMVPRPLGNKNFCQACMVAQSMRIHIDKQASKADVTQVGT